MNEPSAHAGGQMSLFFERRTRMSHTAMTLAVMFGVGVAVAVAFDRVPTWQNHGREAGPGFVRRATAPGMYYSLLIAYTVIATVSAFSTFFRLPWLTITHIRVLFLGAFLLLLAQFLYLTLATTSSQERAQAAWKRIEALGGQGVWESDMVVVSLAGTGVTDDDLALFVDFPHVQILDLSNNALTNNCLKHLDNLKALSSLILVDTAITPEVIDQFKSAHPTVEVRTRPARNDATYPFTDRPFNADTTQ